MGVKFQRQIDLPIKYDGHTLKTALRIDVYVEELIVCELKSAEKMIPLYEAQLLSYLKLTGKRLGFLINFNVPVIKDGIKRRIL
jgi:GxxExxY protein